MIIDAIADNREACAVGIIFFRSVVDKDAPIRNAAPTVCRHAHFVDEKNYVCAGDLTGYALSELTNILA